MSAVAAKRLGNPNWVKGVSGNPKGRRPEPEDATVRELALRYCPDAIHALARLGGIAVDQHGKLLAGARNENARIAALRELLDRGVGKPRQDLTIDGDAVPSLLAQHLFAAEAVSKALHAHPIEPPTINGAAEPVSTSSLLDMPMPLE